MVETRLRRNDRGKDVKASTKYNQEKKAFSMEEELEVGLRHADLGELLT
jgi:hypothetical protein